LMASSSSGFAAIGAMSGAGAVDEVSSSDMDNDTPLSAGAGAMLVACRLAGLSALEAYLCAGQSARAMRGRVWLRGLWLASAGWAGCVWMRLRPESPE
jgi:hypothetical protein